MDKLNRKRLQDIQDTMTQTSQVDDSVRQIADKMAKLKQEPQMMPSVQPVQQRDQVDPLGMLKRDKAIQEIADTQKSIGNDENDFLREKLEMGATLSSREEEKLRNMPGLRQMLLGK